MIMAIKSPLVSFIGVRTSTSKGSTTHHLHTSSGELKDGKFQPVFPIDVPDYGGGDVITTVQFTHTPRPMLRTDAIRWLMTVATFKTALSFLTAEIGRAETRENEEYAKAEMLIAAKKAQAEMLTAAEKASKVEAKHDKKAA